MRYFRTILLSSLLYLAVTANLEWINLVVAGLVGAAIAVLLRPERHPVDPRRVPGAVWAILRYALILARDILKNGLITARIVLDPALPIQPGIVAIPAETKTDFGTALNAHAITVTPGQLVMEIDEKGTMYTHCLDVTWGEKSVVESQRVFRDLMDNISLSRRAEG
jgi:multicomponent Na+:H+ antiporter subunit E